MKHRFLLTLVLAGITAGILLLWFEHSPSTEPANTGSAVQRSQLETEDPGRLFGSGERDVAAKMSARGPDAAEAPANSAAAADVSASEPLKPARVNNDAADFPDDEEPEEPVIAGLVQDDEGNPLSNIEVLAERLDNSNGWEFRDNGLRSSSTRQTATDQNGNFVFTGLGPGLHKMQVSAAGFKIAVLTFDVGIDPIEFVVELEEETQLLPMPSLAQLIYARQNLLDCQCHG